VREAAGAGISAGRAARLRAELVELGIDAELAARLSTLSVRRHPLGLRLGLRGAARFLRRSGVGESAADDVAALLHALDGLDLGWRFDDVIEALVLAGATPPAARGAAFAAARIQRAAPVAFHDPGVGVALVGAALGFLTLAGVLLLRFVLA
jgi:hypothetical protein